MERQIISKRINEILGDLARLSSELRALSSADPKEHADNYEQLSVDAALRSERIACRIRHLIYTSIQPKKAEYLRAAAVAHGIEITQNNGIIEIALPSLMPKRRRRTGTEFLLDPLYFALLDYIGSNELPRFSECVVCFSHVYSRELPSRRIRDYDNLELKQILDVIAGFIMTDDSGLLCDVYNTTAVGDADLTRVSLMERSRFTEWLTERHETLETISDFAK